MGGSAFGLSLYVDEVVTQRDPPAGRSGDDEALRPLSDQQVKSTQVEVAGLVLSARRIGQAEDVLVSEGKSEIGRRRTKGKQI